jgi:putative aminopeptidase FrvX
VERVAEAEFQRLFDELKSLTDLPGTAGFEQPVVRFLRDKVADLCDQVEVDSIGNVYAVVRGEDSGFKVLVPAHSDAVGFVVRFIEPNGHLRIGNLGRIPPYLVYGQRVVIHSENGPLYGVVATKPGHILFASSGAEQREYPAGRLEVPNYDALFVDVGASSAAEADDMGIRPGLEVTQDRPLQWLGDGRNGLVSGRALDDRAGCLAVLESMRQLRQLGRKPQSDVYFAFCSQEEVGLRGAQVAGGYVQPDACIGVDGTISSSGFGQGIVDTPSTSRAEASTVLGGGVGISFGDQSVPGRGLLGNAKLNAFLLALARRDNIPHQLEGLQYYITSDAAAVQYARRGGCPSVTLKVPMCYTHGPVETCSLRDIAWIAELLTQALLELGPATDLAFV